MSTRTATWLALTLWALSLTLFGLSVLLQLVVNDAPTTEDSAFYGLPFLAFVTVGALIASRRPQNPIGWIFCAASLLNVLWSFAVQYATYTLITNPGALPGGMWAAWLTTGWTGDLGWALIIIYTPLLFPNGRLLSPHWRLVAWLAALTTAVVAGSWALQPGPVREEGTLSSFDNPLGIEAAAGVLGVVNSVSEYFAMLLMLAAVISMILRFRWARGEERLQLKWFVYAVGLLPVVFAVALLTELLQVRAQDFVIIPLSVFTLFAIPTATAIAILRYRLYEIDVLINRTLVYGSLTVCLVLAYIGSVVALQGLFRALTGQGSQLAVVASTLAVATLFNPLRRRIQGFIDRRFYRRKYDAGKILAEFSSKLRDETDLDALNHELVEVTRETMQPSHVSLWLRPPQEEGANRSTEEQAG